MTVSNVIASYEATLLANASRIASIESTLRTLSWFIPGRFNDADLASESLYSLTNLVSLYHDNILHKAVSSLPAPLRPPSSSHTRYTRHWTTVSPPYRRMAQLLSVIQSVELFLEMAVRKKKGREGAEKLAIGLEAIKAALRLGLMGATKGRPNVQPPVAEREMDPTLLEKERDRMIRMRKAANSNPSSPGHQSPQSAADVLLRRIDGKETDAELGLLDAEVEEKEFWTGAKSGFVRPTLASLRQEQDAPPPGDPSSTFNPTGTTKDLSREYLSRKVLTIEDVKRPEDLVERAKGVKQLAEIIWILRPLIYVIAMKRYGRRHTLPYLLSLALEYLAYTLRQSSTSRMYASKASGPMLPYAPSELEKQETGKRGQAFWWYLLRGPVWEMWTKPRLEGISDRFADKPLIGFVSTMIKDYTPLIDEYYYYSA
ncbi:peroxisomal membrane protein PEX16 [Sporobolomyces salmoneus]|uniref:peroxisomal membrane protein PEX16 n=1 Tax=Sporobolomyces salmoneus TaxID=183962 RepID=UPI003181522C